MIAVLTAPERIRKPTTTTNARKTSLSSKRAVLVHGQPGDQVVLVNRDAHRVGNDHHEQQRGEAGENEAVDRDDDGGALQVLQLGMGQFAVDLGQRFLAAHGQHGVPEGDQDAENAELSGQILGQVGVLQEAQSFRAELQVVGGGQRAPSEIPASAR